MNKIKWILIKKKKKVTLCEFKSFASFLFWIEPWLDLFKKLRFLWRSFTKLNIFLKLEFGFVTIFRLFSSFFNLNTEIPELFTNIFKSKLYPFLPSSVCHRNYLLLSLYYIKKKMTYWPSWEAFNNTSNLIMVYCITKGIKTTYLTLKKHETLLIK